MTEIDLDVGTIPVKLPDGKSFRLDLIEAVQQIARITRAANPEADEPFAHLEQFTAWVELKTKVSLSLSQADVLWHHLDVEYALSKNQQAERLKSLLPTGATPFA